MKTPVGFELLSYNNTRDDLLKYREQGALRGVYLGFPLLHEHYTMALGSCTDFTGTPGSGKSEFLLELLLNTTKFYGWKHLLYVPDVGDKNEVIATLIHKLTGKTFDKRFENSNYISEQEVEKELNWILEHFKVLVKAELKAKITPYEFWEFAAYMKSKDKMILTATIDSWKDMKHNGHGFGRDDQYLEDVLSFRNAMAEAHQMHFNTIIHPTRTEKDPKTDKRKAPTMYDLKGGTEWANSGKVMITVHRQDGTYNGVDIIITKAKPKSVAKLGVVPMNFDLHKAAFYWIDAGGEKVYANSEYKKPIALQINNNGEEDQDDLPF